MLNKVTRVWLIAVPYFIVYFLIGASFKGMLIEGVNVDQFVTGLIFLWLSLKLPSQVSTLQAPSVNLYVDTKFSLLDKRIEKLEKVKQHAFEQLIQTSE